MGQILDALHHLQEIELQLSDLRKEEERRARQARIAERHIRKLDDQIAGLHAQQAARQTEVNQLERDIKRRDEAISKHREALQRARTNKEYAAILTSINTEKADSSKIEKLALEKLGELERVQAEVEARRQDQQAAEQRRRACEQALTTYIEGTAEQRQSLQTQRDAAAEEIPPTTLNTFTRVAEKHDGEALAEVMRLHPRREEYACGGCNMTVTLDRVSSLRARDELQFCDACGRILYLPSPVTPGA
jgi:predicted  nucleic acid-binding Zn-ribbon protein